MYLIVAFYNTGNPNLAREAPVLRQTSTSHHKAAYSKVVSVWKPPLISETRNRIPILSGAQKARTAS